MFGGKRSGKRMQYYHMRFSNRTFLFIACLAIQFCSCKKQVPACSANCYEVVFAGFIVDKSLNIPLPNQSIAIALRQSGNCWICSSKNIASGKSNSAGYFFITATFDTSLLKTYYIDVLATAADNFINNAQPVGPGILNSKDNLSRRRFSTVDTGAFKNLRFDFYPRAFLKINLHRTSAIVPQYRNLNQSYTFDDHSSVWGLEERTSNTDTTLTIYTAANIFTTIVSSKQQSPTIVTTRTDSIKCLSNTDNAIDITY